jgi:inhibitor of KinA sporulation pathway (predicted exonuclease)
MKHLESPGTAEALLSSVLIHSRGGTEFIRVQEIPSPYRAQFEEALRGSCCPAFESSIAYARDWQAWVFGTWYGRPGPVFAILVIDFEATCSADGSIPDDEREIIEIGAVWVMPAGEVINQMQILVRPVVHPILSGFCSQLTGIRQEDVDQGVAFTDAAAALRDFSQRHRSTNWASWGKSDLRLLERDSARHSIENPLFDWMHQDLKADFAEGRGIRQVGMKTALRLAALPLQGTHHRALADAQNLASLLPIINS